MKNKKRLTALIGCAILLLSIGITSAFTILKKSKKVDTDWTQYYWFDAGGSYLRQNIVDDEIELTTYDEFSYAPYTVREKGYQPTTVSGNPPHPNDPYNPMKLLYTHP